MKTVDKFITFVLNHVVPDMVFVQHTHGICFYFFAHVHHLNRIIHIFFFRAISTEIFPLILATFDKKKKIRKYTDKFKECGYNESITNPDAAVQLQISKI